MNRKLTTTSQADATVKPTYSKAREWEVNAIDSYTWGFAICNEIGLLNIQLAAMVRMPAMTQARMGRWGGVGKVRRITASCVCINEMNSL